MTVWVFLAAVSGAALGAALGVVLGVGFVLWLDKPAPGERRPDLFPDLTNWR